MIPTFNECLAQKEIQENVVDLNNLCTTSSKTKPSMEHPHNILIWKSMGSGSAKFLKDFMYLKLEHHPLIAVIIDTRKTKEEFDL